MNDPIGAAAEEAAEAPTLLDTLARLPAAAALVVAALGKEDRKALRLVHSQMRDVVGEATTKLEVDFKLSPAARPPTPHRWSRLEELHISAFDLAALEALGSGTWSALHTLRVDKPRQALDAPSAARALAAALRQMPALRNLELWGIKVSDASAGELFRAFAAAAPNLRSLSLFADLTPASARAVAAAGWQIDALDLSSNSKLGAAVLTKLCAPPTFAIRQLSLMDCHLDARALLAIAKAPWPLEELDLSQNDFSAAAAAAALAALSRHARLCKLDVSDCDLGAAGFKALVEAAWPALTYLNARAADISTDGAHALGAAAFAGLPALEELDLSEMPLGDTGAALLASRRWARLRKLTLEFANIGAAGFKVLLEAAWPALTSFSALLGNGVKFDGPHALSATAFAGFPALEELDLGEMELGEAGARLFASRRWARLKMLNLAGCRLGDAGVAALARGEFPALARLCLSDNGLGAPPTLEAARRWAPSLENLQA